MTSVTVAVTGLEARVFTSYVTASSIDATGNNKMKVLLPRQTVQLYDPVFVDRLIRTTQMGLDDLFGAVFGSTVVPGTVLSTITPLFELTRQEIPSTVISLDTFEVSGYYEIGDLGQGARYIRGSASGAYSIRDAAGTWFELSWTNVLSAGWFGIKSDLTFNSSPGFQTWMGLLCQTSRQTYHGLRGSIPEGRFMINEQIVGWMAGTVSETYYNALIFEGAGKQVTKLYANEDNAAGVFWIITPWDKHYISFDEMDVVSTIDLADASNAGKTNGNALRVTCTNGNVFTPLPGLLQDKSVWVRHNFSVTTDDQSEGVAQFQQGCWSKAILIEFMWIPLVSAYIRVASYPDDELFPDPDDSQRPGLTDVTIQNNAGVYFRHCYLPCMSGHWNINGYFQRAITIGSVLTDVGLPTVTQRVEGFDISEGFMNGPMDGITTEMPWSTEPALFSDDARISNIDYYCKRFGLNIHYWQLLTVDGVTCFGPVGPWGDELLPAAMMFDGCDTVNIIGPQITIPGYMTSDTEASCGIRLKGAISNVKIADPMFNMGGFGVYVDDLTVPSNVYVHNRSIEITNPKFYGRKLEPEWADFELLYDPGHYVVITGERIVDTAADAIQTTGSQSGADYTIKDYLFANRDDISGGTNLLLGTRAFRANDAAGNRLTYAGSKGTAEVTTGGAAAGGHRLTVLSNGSEVDYHIASGSTLTVINAIRNRFDGTIELVPTAVPASPSAGNGVLYIDASDGNKFKIKFSTGTVVLLGTP